MTAFAYSDDFLNPVSCSASPPNSLYMDMTFVLNIFSHSLSGAGCPIMLCQAYTMAFLPAAAHITR